jgi:radical SAM protein with 4Fe4S-binding SPASM domain
MKRPSYHRILRPEEIGLWKKRTPLLTYLDMELTERCNNDCIHCYINLPANDKNAKAKELSTKKIKAILEEAVSLGCLEARYTGGEPLLREDFEELYVFARKLGLKVIIFTNATLVSPRLAEIFSRIPPREKIEVTVYGMTKSSYEKTTRVPGSFEAAWRGIRLLQEKKIPFVAKGAFLPFNKDEIREFESWASGIPWMDHSPPYSQFFNFRCRRDSDKKNRLIKSLRLPPEEGLRFLVRNESEFIEEMKGFCSKFMAPTGRKLFSCGAGNGRGCVDAYGYFSPCMLLKNPETNYNLDKGSLKDALTVFFPKIREMRAKNRDYLARCARCFLKGLCSQCPARSWMENGELDAPVEFLCQIAHAKARYLNLLMTDERAWEVKEWKGRIQGFLSAN